MRTNTNINIVVYPMLLMEIEPQIATSIMLQSTSLDKDSDIRLKNIAALRSHFAFEDLPTHMLNPCLALEEIQLKCDVGRRRRSRLCNQNFMGMKNRIIAISLGKQKNVCRGDIFVLCWCNATYFCWVSFMVFSTDVYVNRPYECASECQ